MTESNCHQLCLFGFMTSSDCNNFILFSLFNYNQNRVHYLYIFDSLLLIKIRNNREYFHSHISCSFMFISLFS